MELATVVAANSAKALGMVAARLGDDAVLIDARTHARGIEMVAASDRVAPAVARFAMQARALGFARTAYEPMLRALDGPVGTADLWVRFVTHIERRLTVFAHNVADLDTVIAGPAALTSPIARALAARHRAQVWPLGATPPAGETGYYIAGGGPAEARRALDGLRAVRPRRCFVALPADTPAPWADAFADADGAIIADDLATPGFAISVLLAHDLPLAFLTGPDGVAAARMSKVARAIVVALGRLGDGGRRWRAPLD